ncbi:MAG: hypothetical protein JXQ89_22995 [Pelagimonas sp.]
MIENYVIVGKRIDSDDMLYLHADETIDSSPERNGVRGEALNVEYIGKTLVELSEKPPLERGSDAYKKVVDRIKKAMMVQGPPGHTADDPALQEIWDNTTIELEYDQRTKASGEADVNVRKLVVPATGALAHKQSLFLARGKESGFQPPLTYALDRMLMKEYFNPILSSVVTEFRDEDGAPLPQATQDGLLKLVAEKFGPLPDLEDDAEDPAEQDMVRILNSPVSAFHRSVGIYITQMCN